MSAFVTLTAILAVVSILANISLFIVNRDQAAQLRRRERDVRISELERDLNMNLPATFDVARSNHLSYVLGMVLGAWLREKYRR